MAEAVKYLVDLERDEKGWWVASVRGVAGCRTQGRSVRQAKSRTVEAMATHDIRVSTDDLELKIHLPKHVREAVARYETARDRSDRERQRAREATIDAVQIVVNDAGMSVRDAAELLGLSHQRVQQLRVDQPPEPPATSRS